MIRFYDNVIQQLINDPDIFKGDIYCALVDNYEFVSSDTNIADITNRVSNITHIPHTGYELNENFPTSLFFTAGSVVIEHVPVNTSYSGVLFSNYDGQLLFYLDAIPGLPGTSLGGNVQLSFSSNANKLFRLESLNNQATSGSHIVWATEPVIPVDTPTHVLRPGGNISYGDVVSEQVGKRGIYKDLSISGLAHPLTGDLTTVTDEKSINQAIRLLLLTDEMERPFSSIKIGGGVKSLLFDLGNNARAIENQISLTIINHEPRVMINEIVVTEYPDKNALSILVEYTIRATGVSGTFTHTLKRA